jgi:hypothetical protein
MKSDIIGFVLWLIGLGMPEHARHQMHTDCAQELFLMQRREKRLGINVIECRYAFIVG